MKNQLEYTIEQHKADVVIRQEDKKYIYMFIYSGSHWCFALPVQSMYLQTLDKVIKDIERQKKYDKERGWQCAYKIAEIIN